MPSERLTTQWYTSELSWTQKRYLCIILYRKCIYIYFLSFQTTIFQLNAKYIEAEREKMEMLSQLDVYKVAYRDEKKKLVLQNY